MNRFEKSLNEMKNYIVTPTAPLKAVTEEWYSYKEPPIPPTGVNQQKPVEVTKETEPQNSDDIHPPTVQAEVQKDKLADEHVVVIPKLNPIFLTFLDSKKKKIEKRMTF
nr:hypothetical protein [Tanacetum cinerariifolium]